MFFGLSSGVGNFVDVADCFVIVDMIAETIELLTIEMRLANLF